MQELLFKRLAYWGGEKDVKEVLDLLRKIGDGKTNAAKGETQEDRDKFISDVEKFFGV